MSFFSDLQCCWETVKFQMLIQQEAKDYVHPLSAGLTQNVLCRTFFSQCCRWLTQSMVWTARSKILFHPFFTLLQKDESCVQSKACLSFFLLLTVESLIYFSKFFVANIICARQSLCFNILVNRYNSLILQDYYRHVLWEDQKLFYIFS